MFRLRTTKECTRRLRWATIGLCLPRSPRWAGCRVATPSTQEPVIQVPGLRETDRRLSDERLAGPSEVAGMAAAVPIGSSIRQIRPALQEERMILPPGRTEALGQPSDAGSGQPPPEETIDLGVALRLAGVSNPTINLAQEEIQEALAGQLAARSLLLPSINLGGSFRLHRGVLQDDPGNLLNPNSQSLYLGAGALAIGTGTQTIPGVWLFAHLGDAVYEPLAARQRVRMRTFDAQVVENAVLLSVATAYLELAGAESRLELLRRAESDVREIVRITTAFAETGQGTQADRNRSAANAELVRSQIPEAEGEIASASAECRSCSTSIHRPGSTPGERSSRCGW